MLEFLPSFFAASQFIPEGNCYLWKPELISLQVGSDFSIALAYYAISISLFYFLKKRRDLPFDWLFLLFGTFIILSGTNHLMQVWTFWQPAYWLSGCLKAATAGVSIYAAVSLAKLTPKLLALPSPAEMEAANCKLEGEVFVRKQIEEQLISSQEMLKLVMDNIPQMIFWKDRNSVYLGCNRSFAKVAGLENSERIIGKNDYDLPWTLEQTKFYRTCDARVMETDTAEYDIIEPLQQADGQEAWLNTNKIPLHNKEGKVVGILGTVEDITDRKQAEEKLKKAVEERTKELREAIAQLQGEIGERQQVEAALRESQDRLQEIVVREALLNRLASQIRRSLDINIILETAVREIREVLGIDRCIFLWYRGENTPPVWEFIQEARNQVFPSLIGRKVSATALNLLTNKAFDKQITRVDNARVLSDPLEKRFFFSVGYTALLALPIHTQSGEIGIVSCAHCTGARPWRDSEVELLEAIADQLAIAIDQAALYKQSRHAAAVAQAQAQQLEQALGELKQAQAQLVQSEKMSSLGQLVAGVAHEINNPVNFIYGNITPANEYASDLLRVIKLYQKYYPEPPAEIEDEIEAIDLDFIREDLRKILSSMKIGADRIRQIVLTLRNFSRLDEAEMKKVDIHEGIDSTLLLLQNRLLRGSRQSQETGNHPPIQVIKEYGELPLIECYPGQLNQVFMNILSNAIDALQEQINRVKASSQTSSFPNCELPTIRIQTKTVDSDRVIIRIADNGVGMTEEVRTKLFDPFFTTKPVGYGTGLGMSITYQIILEKHRGRLECLSELGKGTELLIEIPIRQQIEE